MSEKRLASYPSNGNLEGEINVRFHTIVEHHSLSTVETEMLICIIDDIAKHQATDARYIPDNIPPKLYEALFAYYDGLKSTYEGRAKECQSTSEAAHAAWHGSALNQKTT